ncbi:hypothetical protein EVAR_12486_1 [Eumeta japonica]|uniref:Uncharacterized protein n=1 Tax=Eumeta variegata TaxID=151549 RepID=A0A4C1TPK1_EUMVA|nr:hypothetical protein EVAR_12486_1 [Eumeta japonica]
MSDHAHYRVPKRLLQKNELQMKKDGQSSRLISERISAGACPRAPGAWERPPRRLVGHSGPFVLPFERAPTAVTRDYTPPFANSSSAHTPSACVQLDLRSLIEVQLLGIIIKTLQ